MRTNEIREQQFQLVIIDNKIGYLSPEGEMIGKFIDDNSEVTDDMIEELAEIAYNVWRCINHFRVHEKTFDNVEISLNDIKIRDDKNEIMFRISGEDVNDALWYTLESIHKYAMDYIHRLGTYVEVNRNKRLYLKDIEQSKNYLYSNTEIDIANSRMKGRYHSVLKHYGITKNIEYIDRFKIYMQDERNRCLMNLEGYNDKIICNIIFGILNNMTRNEAIKNITDDIGMVYGCDHLYGVFSNLDLSPDDMDLSRCGYMIFQDDSPMKAYFKH